MKRNFSTLAILLALFSLCLASCASKNKTCDAYQCVELETEK
ncbi:MAG: hypothetical protein VX548_06360 [Bacteroidota bacterium]|nr:hypothetical protein [Bacteroidota bacterium]